MGFSKYNGLMGLSIFNHTFNDSVRLKKLAVKCDTYSNVKYSTTRHNAFDPSLYTGFIWVLLVLGYAIKFSQI